MRRVGIFGWGIVAPRSPNVDAFERNLAEGGSWLSAFEGFGPSNFLAGTPQFDLADYKAWIDARFPPTRFGQLGKKMGLPAQMAIGAFIQSLAQNPGLEQELQALGTQAHVYVGSGLGDVDTTYQASLSVHRAQRRWDRFWAQPQRNSALAAWLALPPEARAQSGAPPEPGSVPEHERDEAEDAFWHHWAARSPQLHEYLRELEEIDSLGVEGDVESAKLAVIKEKRTRTQRLQKKWEAPEPPWGAVSPNLLWNIHNGGAAQISMMGKITGATFAPVAACSTFGYSLKLGMNAIALGEARAVVIGAADPAPHVLTVGGFYSARVLAATGVSKPLTDLRGTHVAGGAAVWVLGDYEYMTSRGFKPLGMEPLAVGLTSDADHIITPSKEGPTAALHLALERAHVRPEEVVSWDLHATATPGDHLEVQTLRDTLPEHVLVTARKGTFGHGMGVCGGWELTAQYMGYARGVLMPTPLQPEELNPEIRKVHERFVYANGAAAPLGVAGKMSMGVGGTNACVLSRPWKKA
ncbi:MAG TPA: beta-ketoacyl synthase N-terminal-like domain-containing protein [Aggregicoccus sp.]|nr:beta-ketoacyl synthase N-terminal-like domain-containing protein [Aggregicoccus sp.]